MGTTSIGEMINPEVNSNGVRIEEPGPSRGLDRFSRSEWTGPTLTGLTVELLGSAREHMDPGGRVQRQGRGAMTIAARQGDHRAFNVIIAG